MLLNTTPPVAGAAAPDPVKKTLKKSKTDTQKSKTDTPPISLLDDNSEDWSADPIYRTIAGVGLTRASITRLWGGETAESKYFDYELMSTGASLITGGKYQTSLRPHNAGPANRVGAVRGLKRWDQTNAVADGLWMQVLHDKGNHWVLVVGTATGLYIIDTLSPKASDELQPKVSSEMSNYIDQLTGAKNAVASSSSSAAAADSAGSVPVPAQWARAPTHISVQQQANGMRQTRLFGTTNSCRLDVDCGPAILAFAFMAKWLKGDPTRIASVQFDYSRLRACVRYCILTASFNSESMCYALVCIQNAVASQ